MNNLAVSAQQSATAPQCIPGCTADHAGQPVNLRECTATDQVGAVSGTVAGMTPAHVSAMRWQDNAVVSGEVVILPPQRDTDPDGNPEPLTFTPAQARDLATMLNHAAGLVELDSGGAR